MEKSESRYIYYRIKPNEDYYIIEFQNDENFSFISIEKIKDILLDEGFDTDDLIMIKSIEYKTDKEKDFTILNCEKEIANDVKKIFIELEISEQITETESQNQYDNELQYYEANIIELQKEIKRISQEDFNIDNKVHKNIE